MGGDVALRCGLSRLGLPDRRLGGMLYPLAELEFCGEVDGEFIGEGMVDAGSGAGSLEADV